MSTRSNMPALTVSASNCEAVTGMSWKWVQRFALAHDVPIYRIARRPLIPAAQLAAAFERAAASVAPGTAADEVARLKAEIVAELHRNG